MAHYTICAVRSEFHRDELTTAISSQHVQLLPALSRRCSHINRLLSPTSKMKYLRSILQEEQPPCFPARQLSHSSPAC